MRIHPMLLRLLLTKHWSIRYKQLAILLFTSLVPLVLFMGFSTLKSYSDAIEEVHLSLDHVVDSSGILIENELESAVEDVYNHSRETVFAAQIRLFVHSISESSQGTNSIQDLPRAPGVMHQELVRHDDYLSIRLLAADGRLLAQVGDSTLIPGIAEPFQAELPAYRGLAGYTQDFDRAVLLAPYPDPETGGVVLEVGTFVWDADAGDLLGYLIYTLNPQVLVDRPLLAVAHSVIQETESERHLFIVNEDGWLLSTVEDVTPFTWHVQLDSLRSDDSYERDWGGGPVTVIGRWYTLPDIGWTVVAEISLQSVVQPIFGDLFSSIGPMLLIVFVLAGSMLFIVDRRFVVPVMDLIRVAQQAASGNLSVRATRLDRRDEIGQLNNALFTMIENLRVSIENVELRAQQRVRDLQMSTIIARQASRLERVDTLLSSAVDLIVENFSSVYHAQVFLIDELGEYANLAASTGEPGRHMLARGYRLPVGSLTMIGRVTELGQIVVVYDVATSHDYLKNELLPETHAEIVLPLFRADEIIGALDLHSVTAGVFSPDEQLVFETLADQLSAAIENARRYEHARQLAQEADSLNRLLTRTEWKQLLSSARRPGYIAATAGLEAPDTGTGWSEWQHLAVQQSEPVVSPVLEDGTCIMAVPIVSRGEVLGAVEWQVDPTLVTPNTRQMARELVERLATTMETVRLLERTERLAERERLVNEISGRLTAESNVERILKVAVQQLTDVLQTPKVSIQLNKATAAPETSPTENP